MGRSWELACISVPQRKRMKSMLNCYLAQYEKQFCSTSIVLGLLKCPNKVCWQTRSRNNVFVLKNVTIWHKMPIMASLETVGSQSTRCARSNQIDSKWSSPIQVRRTEEDAVNYLQVVFEFNSKVYAYTFSPSGDEIYMKGNTTDWCRNLSMSSVQWARNFPSVDNCTDSTFLTLALPNGKVHKIKQSSHTADGIPTVWQSPSGDNLKLFNVPYCITFSWTERETVADVTSLPYITFYHVNGAKYNINFLRNGSDTSPSIGNSIEFLMKSRFSFNFVFCWSSWHRYNPQRLCSKYFR